MLLLSRHYSVVCLILILLINALVAAAGFPWTWLTFWCPVFHLRRRLHKLGVSKITQVDFLPREVVSYSKETQTPLATHQSEGKINLLFGLVVFWFCFLQAYFHRSEAFKLKNIWKRITNHSLVIYHTFTASQLLFVWLMPVLVRIIIIMAWKLGGTKVLLPYNRLCSGSSWARRCLQINHSECHENSALFCSFLLSQGGFSVSAFWRGSEGELSSDILAAVVEVDEF